MAAHIVNTILGVRHRSRPRLHSGTRDPNSLDANLELPGTTTDVPFSGAFDLWDHKTVPRGHFQQSKTSFFFQIWRFLDLVTRMVSRSPTHVDFLPTARKLRSPIVLAEGAKAQPHTSRPWPLVMGHSVYQKWLDICPRTTEKCVVFECRQLPVILKMDPLHYLRTCSARVANSAREKRRSAEPLRARKTKPQTATASHTEPPRATFREQKTTPCRNRFSATSRSSSATSFFFLRRTSLEHCDVMLQT